jgi:hypothetical protein
MTKRLPATCSESDCKCEENEIFSRKQPFVVLITLTHVAVVSSVMEPAHALQRKATTHIYNEQ